METFLKPLELLKIVSDLPAGERYEYYQGYLPEQRTRAKRKLSDAVMLLEMDGVVLLVQKRLGYQKYSYFLIRTTRGKITPILRFKLKHIEERAR